MNCLCTAGQLNEQSVINALIPFNTYLSMYSYPTDCNTVKANRYYKFRVFLKCCCTRTIDSPQKLRCLSYSIFVPCFFLVWWNSKLETYNFIGICHAVLQCYVHYQCVWNISKCVKAIALSKYCECIAVINFSLKVIRCDYSWECSWQQTWLVHCGLTELLMKASDSREILIFC